MAEFSSNARVSIPTALQNQMHGAHHMDCVKALWITKTMLSVVVALPRRKPFHLKISVLIYGK